MNRMWNESDAPSIGLCPSVLQGPSMRGRGATIVASHLLASGVAAAETVAARAHPVASAHQEEVPHRGNWPLTLRHPFPSSEDMTPWQA